MKSRPSIYAAVLLLGLWHAGTILPACNKSNNQSGKIDTANSSITTLLKASTNATLFYYAMTRTGLDSLLDNGVGRFTVFVPTDNAFQNSGFSKSFLQASSDSTLKDLVSYLIYGHEIYSSDINGRNQPLVQANNESVYLTNNTNEFLINAIPFAQSEVLARNGAIFMIIDSVPLSPKGGLLQLIQSDTLFAYLSAAINRASTLPFDRISVVLENNGPTTLFAPTNQAFRDFGFSDTAAINAVSPDSLELLLSNHILQGIMFNSDIANGQRNIAMNPTDTLRFRTSGMSVQVFGNQNILPANVLKANVLATNGVLYTIDQVLKP